MLAALQLPLASSSTNDYNRKQDLRPAGDGAQLGFEAGEDHIYVEGWGWENPENMIRVVALKFGKDLYRQNQG